ncbi:MAG: LamG domain-containing protein, partial [Mucilaginibacter sp.]
LSAWVKLGATGLDQKVMTNQTSSAGSSGGYKLGVYTTNIPESESGTAINRTSTPNPTAFAAGAWHYIQSVYTGTTLSTYVDGAQYKNLSTTNNPSVNTTLYIGVGEGGTILYFNGVIDEPRVSNVAKSADWIKAEYGNQNSPATFTTVGTTVTNTTNAAAIAGALTYTWTGATSTDPAVAGNWNNTTAGTTSQLPAFDGTATLVVPAGLSNYPALTVDASLYGLTIASGASLNLIGHTLSVGCNIYNNATTGGTGILYGSNTASGITWNGSSSAQTFTGANTANTTQLGNMTLNNSSAGTLTVTGGPVDVYNTLTITKGNLVINNAGNGALTLKSSSSLTASVAAIPAAYSITGNVNVERFLTGGSTVSGGRWVYRNYRLMSSPVNAGLVSGKYPYTVNYIAASAIVTGAKSSYGTVGGNPTIYVYSEDYTPSNAGFTTGNFKGVTDMSTLTSPYTLTVSNNGTTKALYVGNGFMFYFRGDKINSVGTSPGKTTYPYVAPESVVFTATGNLNQGSYTVNNWQTGSGLLFTTVTGNSLIQGFNLVGNPYASTIDWETVNSGGIVATNINPSIYVFNPVTNQYNTYSSNTHVGNPVAFTGKIASGQGFFVKANNTSPALVFNESAKSTTVINAGSGNLMMGTPAGQAITQQLLRWRLSIDSINYDDIAIGFKSTASGRYDLSEDSKYLSGLGAAEGLASYSTDTIPQALAINFLHLPKKAPQVIKLSVTAKNSGRLTLEKTQLDSLPKIYE